MGSILGRVIPKTLKIVPVATSLGAQHHKASTGSQTYSHLMRKPTICIGENKDADQLRGNREADQRLCFRYRDSTILLLSKSKISSF